MIKIILSFMLILGIAYAQQNQKTNKEPIVINADKLEYNNKERLAIYSGNVDVKKGNFNLKADVIKIYLDDKGDVSKIYAIGNVYFQKENKWGKSKEGEYYKDKNLIILKGNAEVHQDDNVVEGDEIQYYLDEERAIAISKSNRVRSVIFPKEKEGK
ncbi:MAG: lipopolysaccharide transport periplasmic protein LptA [Sulfurihydrogenibium sp.]|uniref:Lipopolysaccharide transport periplasmic protein LptA n=1 Tax=Sulfurihydrogenibium azorense TaxID=309806 RepID=A0A831YB93_9AQUI|nr:MAG: lipopolysaccharide transport periplasmic protein LptA [Sulfurihydrogenibium sp.]PMP77865.1 MAG: lipopolysaccharide transport periplasmic protein LptA [Sulfurihydrogenibium sp.]HEV09580.1 lipopolysaccharide transport periplasmic protein LptA [Sulfurihydrogenibium azorense]